MFKWEEKLISFVKRYYNFISGMMIFVLALAVRVAIVRGLKNEAFWSVNIHPIFANIFASDKGMIYRYLWSFVDVLIPICFFTVVFEEMNIYSSTLFLFNPALIFSSTFSGGIVTPMLACGLIVCMLLKKKKKVLTVVFAGIIVILFILVNVIIYRRTELWAGYLLAYYKESICLLKNHQIWTFICSMGILLSSGLKNRVYRMSIPAICTLFSTIIYAGNMFDVLR